ncbi:MAG: glutamine--fructose-6-phosphate transaminase (isomerizing) [Desulfobulbaceae bacterium]|nr:glutamine--fructose-6-phosphate transaminase (isomerizing) [Candidatus Kapabacteria bacterium]MBS3999996.1 glutamine--fructose-6-phosphate transaminase (isomerizing) [Desulfobulbaceae bacterium]
MCGIVGYLGKSSAANILINGLKRMEYRGYDSAGMAVLNDGIIKTTKKKGKVSELERLVDLSKENSTIGIAHTRWATHGFPNDINAHPHSDQANKITIVHNGIIENYTAIKKKLTLDGYQFKSETDTEVLAVFIGALYERFGDLEYAVRFALSEVDGTFGMLVLSADHPDMLIAARRGSPLLIGIGDDEFVAASDAAAVIQYTKQVIYLNDNEIAIITRDGYHTKTISNEDTISKIEQIEFDLEQIEKGGFEHFMLKEIFEQPETIQNAFRGRLLVDEGDVKLGGLRQIQEQLRSAERIIITACGTSWHAGLVGEYMIEHLANIPVEVEYASEFRYRNPVIKKNDIVLAISQSGETADTMAAVREAKQKGATVLGIVNVVGSSIARYTSAGVYTHAGPEIGVASTKAFTSQLTVLSLIAIMFGRMNTLSKYEGIKIAKELLNIPDKIKKIFESADKIQQIAKQHAKAKNFLYLGRGYNFPVALEGALKLKEISYIHAEGYPAAEMKHGPIALIDENMPVVFIATQDEIYEKIISNIEEVKARKGKIIAIATEGDTRIESVADNVIYIPETLPMLTPILSVIPFQLLAYYTALELDCDIDKPRNLAKSVTVE